MGMVLSWVVSLNYYSRLQSRNGLEIMSTIFHGIPQQYCPDRLAASVRKIALFASDSQRQSTPLPWSYPWCLTQTQPTTSSNWCISSPVIVPLRICLIHHPHCGLRQSCQYYEPLTIAIYSTLPVRRPTVPYFVLSWISSQPSSASQACYTKLFLQIKYTLWKIINILWSKDCGPPHDTLHEF